MLFRLRKGCGNHEQNGRLYKPGDIIETSLDLPSMFKANKFERIRKTKGHTGPADTGTVIATKTRPPSSPTAEDVPEEDKNPRANRGYGKDVSSEFSTAKEAAVKVFRKGNWFLVVDKNDGQVLNEKKLRRKEVEPFIEQYLNPPEEDDVEDEDVEDEDV